MSSNVADPIDEILAPARRRLLVAEVVRDLDPDVYERCEQMAALRQRNPDQYARAMRGFELSLHVRPRHRGG
jgi:hypothetical protein